MSDDDAPTVDPRAVVPPYNWRVPVLGDVPNVPSDLTNLATDIAGTVAAVRSAGTLIYRSGSYPNDTRLSTIDGATVQGSIQSDGAGRLTLTETGVYSVTATITTSNGSIWIRAVPSNDARTIQMQGPICQGAAVGSSAGHAALLKVTAVPLALGLWYQGGAVGNVQSAGQTFMSIVREGNI